MTTATNWKNVNNWHWVDKNCLPWAVTYFEKLKGITVTVGDISATVSEVTSVTGDCDLNQRKGQVIHIFDLALNLKWTGSKNGLECTGKINMPEFMHDTNINDLVLEVTVDDSTREKEVIKEVVRKDLSKKIKEAFRDFHEDLMDAHSKDVFISDKEMNGHPVTSTSYKPKPPVPAVAVAVESSPSSVKGTLVSIQKTLEFQCATGDLYEVLVSRPKVQLWTRAPAEIEPTEGSEFVLFGGNVSGKFIKLVPGKLIEMKWRLKTWPSEHISHVTINLTQNSNGTQLKMLQKDVPIGEKDIVERNWPTYYWEPINRTFGFGASL